MSRFVFINEDNENLTRRIDKPEVLGTVKWLEPIVGINFNEDLGLDGYPKKWLGTTGRSINSKDIDLSVDSKEKDKHSLVKSLIEWCLRNGVGKNDVFNRKLSSSTLGKKDGWIDVTNDTIHFRTPILGDSKNGFVQTDLMFTEDPEYQYWAMRAGKEGSKFKGKHRHQLISSIVRSKENNLEYSPFRGLINTNSGKVLSTDPNEISRILLGDDALREDIDNTDSILEKIKGHPDFEKMVLEFREQLKKDPKGPQLEFTNMEIGSPVWFRYIINKFS